MPFLKVPVIESVEYQEESTEVKAAESTDTVESVDYDSKTAETTDSTKATETVDAVSSPSASSSSKFLNSASVSFSSDSLYSTVPITLDTKSPAESFEKGKKFFKTNQPQLAIPYLENALTDSSIDPSAYIFLGVSYYQTAQFEKSIRINEAGMRVKDSNTAVLAYNGGNAAFSLGDWDRADVMFSLSITANPMYASAWLNRANTRMNQDRLDKAIDDYYNKIEEINKIEADKRKAHQNQLLYQIREKEDLRKRERQDVKYEERAAQLWEMEYQQKINEQKEIHRQRLKAIREKNQEMI